jgi:hypothetical protein
MLNKIKKFNKIQKASLIALIVMLFCQLGGLTWAWLTDHDEVTNVFGFHDYYVDIVLTEPNWVSVGSKQASVMQPGMDIFKDPRVTNITEDDCFVRMQIILADKEDNVLDDLIKNESDSTKKAALEAKRAAILKSIAYYNEDSKTFTSYNTDFTPYSDGYYYYTEGGDNCVALATGETTSPLFTDVKIPTLKTDYAYFADGFVITIKAEAVFTAGATDASVETIAARFANTGDADSSEEGEDTEEKVMEAISTSTVGGDTTDTDKTDTDTDGADAGTDGASTSTDGASTSTEGTAAKSRRRVLDTDVSDTVTTPSSFESGVE